MDNLENVLVGNILLNPKVLRACLKKTRYSMTYDKETEVISFRTNGMNPGLGEIFQIRNASYENAQKLAEGLGLRSNGLSRLSWSKYNPELILSDDGSLDATALKTELQNSGIPFTVCKSKLLSLKDWGQTWEYPSWSLEKLIEIVREIASRNSENLITTP